MSRGLFELPKWEAAGCVVSCWEQGLHGSFDVSEAVADG